MNRVTFYPSVLETFENFPYTEETIHDYDVELIKNYLTEHVKSHKKLVTDYLIKILDNSTLGSATPIVKTRIIGQDFMSLLKKEIGEDDDEDYYTLKEEIIKLKAEVKSLKKLIKK